MRNKVGFFVSYAHADGAVAGDLLDRLRGQLGISLRYEYALWQDTALLVGEEWECEIRDALEHSDFGLLLVSPAFLGSKYITEVELRALLGRPVMPVLLEAVNHARHDLRGLDDKQIYALTAGRTRQRRAYADCAGKDRRRFAQELFEQIEQRLDKLSAGWGKGWP